ncbi:MAG: two-component sensor histidine kinase, partial [Sulfurimonas sp.]
MLVSKSLDTDLHRSEKQTLFRFSALYTLLAIVLIFVFSFIYYELQKDLMLEQKKAMLQEYSKELLENLKQLHINFDKTQIYPRSEHYNSVIYDNEEKLIFSTSTAKTRLNKILYLNNGDIHLVSIPESYYLGAKYVIVKVKDEKELLRKLLPLITFEFISSYFTFN